MEEGNIAYIDEEYELALEVPTKNPLSSPHRVRCRQKYNQAAESLPTHAPLFYCRGSTKLKLKKYLEALQDFNLSISLDNSHEPIYFKKG
jgi:hypothetical protein